MDEQEEIRTIQISRKQIEAIIRAAYLIERSGHKDAGDFPEALEDLNDAWFEARSSARLVEKF